MKITLCLIAASVLSQCVYSAPGDMFEACSKSCSKDPAEQVRLNAWKMNDTAQDKCMATCSFKALKMIKDNGDLDMDAFNKMAANKEPKINTAPLKVRNVNLPGFMAGFVKFMNTNRVGLAKLLNHAEGGVNWEVSVIDDDDDGGSFPFLFCSKIYTKAQ